MHKKRLDYSVPLCYNPSLPLEKRKIPHYHTCKCDNSGILCIVMHMKFLNVM